MNVRFMPELAPYTVEADHVDIKTVEGRLTLREFLARLLSYQPGWVVFLFRVRGILAGLLGLDHAPPDTPQMAPADIPTTPGETIRFFTVRAADPDRYWVAGIKDDHLDAEISVVAEPLAGSARRFHVMTTVHCNNWRGPLYFNIIRPFHHLIVDQMARAAVRGREEITPVDKRTTGSRWVLITGILIAILGVIHCAFTPVVMADLAYLPGADYLTFLFMFVGTGLGVIGAGLLTAYSAPGLKRAERWAGVAATGAGLFVLLLGIGAVVTMPGNPFAFIMLALALANSAPLLIYRDAFKTGNGG